MIFVFCFFPKVIIYILSVLPFSETVYNLFFFLPCFFLSFFAFNLVINYFLCSITLYCSYIHSSYFWSFYSSHFLSYFRFLVFVSFYILLFYHRFLEVFISYLLLFDTHFLFITKYCEYIISHWTYIGHIGILNYLFLILLLFFFCSFLFVAYVYVCCMLICYCHILLRNIEKIHNIYHQYEKCILVIISQNHYYQTIY